MHDELKVDVRILAANNIEVEFLKNSGYEKVDGDLISVKDGETKTVLFKTRV